MNTSGQYAATTRRGQMKGKKPKKLTPPKMAKGMPMMHDMPPMGRGKKGKGSMFKKKGM